MSSCMHTLADYANRYEGRTFVVVGKGATRYEYANLSEVRDPIIFLNDAVQFERHATNAPETFFFCHDPCQAVWLTPQLRSTAVLPVADAIDSAGTPLLSVATHAPACANVITYRWWNEWRNRRSQLCHMTRAALAESQQLFLATGTIHSAIHFAWLAGATRLVFIGCDGWRHPIAPDRVYDKRIRLRAGGKHKNAFARIRRDQDWLCETLHLDTEYVNEPRITPQIPRIAHFIWLGEWEPAVGQNIGVFHQHNPDWDVRVLSKLDRRMPADLFRIASDCAQYCTQKDVMSYWLLHTEGGIFLDADMVTVRNMDPLRRYTAFACRQHDSRINCAAMGSVPGGTAIGRVLDAIRERGAWTEGHRTQFGPKLLTELFGDKGQGTSEFSILPRHYFYLLVNQKQAHPWWEATDRVRASIMAEHATHCVDPTPPYAVHLWGINGSSLRMAYQHGDALCARLYGHFGSQSIRGAEVGVLAGKLSVYLLRNLSRLHLIMVDAWPNETSKPSPGGRVGGLADKALATARTDDFSCRRSIVHASSMEAASAIPDDSLDFVFIDADHRYEAVRDDLYAWYTTVRPGGLICGHDWENPIGPEWGVRKAVNEFRRHHGINTPIDLGAGTTWFFVKPGGSA